MRIMIDFLPMIYSFFSFRKNNKKKKKKKLLRKAKISICTCVTRLCFFFYFSLHIIRLNCVSVPLSFEQIRRQCKYHFDINNHIRTFIYNYLIFID